jgi:DNA modification methylase
MGASDLDTHTSSPHRLTVRRVPLDSIREDPANARLHNDRNLDAILGSLHRFGQAEPLVVNARTGRLVAGHGRLAAMRKLGWKEADVVDVDLAEIDATALGIALNRSASLAEWDETALGKLLEQLRAEDSLEGVGFDLDEINELLAKLEAEAGMGPVEDAGPPDPPVDPVSALGDLWLLGGNRLLCGDSTKLEDVGRVMHGARASLLATDPPYLVDYDGSNHPADHHKRAGRKAAPGKEVGNRTWDSYVDQESSVEFYRAYLAAALVHCIERVPVYQWYASRRVRLVEEAWEQNGLLVHQQLVWAKSRGVLTRSHFLWAHEPAIYGWPEGKMPEKDRRPATTATTVWPIDQADEPKGLHPTLKPLEVFERPIGWHTRPGEVCLEPFSGGGTQIIAAEKLGRRCYALELSPAFVDVGVRRWEKATGKQATLDGTGQTFAQIAAARGKEVA